LLSHLLYSAGRKLLHAHPEKQSQDAAQVPLLQLEIPLSLDILQVRKATTSACQIYSVHGLEAHVR
jgi:hypothetical protein